MRNALANLASNVAFFTYRRLSSFDALFAGVVFVAVVVGSASAAFKLLVV